jgi:hypothetical protein
MGNKVHSIIALMRISVREPVETLVMGLFLAAKPEVREGEVMRVASDNELEALVNRFFYLTT